jgi:hypothetical protein
MMKNIYILICFLLTSIVSVAQSHEFSIYAGGGLSNLSYTLAGGDVSGGIGGGAGAGYTYNISVHFGITTGVGFALYGGKATSRVLSGQYNTPDDAGDDFRFSYSVAGYEEKQSAAMVTIPLMLQYGTGGNSMSFVLAGGVKLGLPMSAKTTITPGSITTSGHYAYENRTYTDLPQYGFVTDQSGSVTKSDIELGLTTILSLEAGLRFSLSDKLGLYTGLFLDYGLNSIQKINDRHVVEYQPSNPSQFKYNSILNTGMVDKINLMSVGIKVKLGIRN